ncbi:dentin sialophosphoprotein isoform X2 [Coccinella septempunctata]|uniref:dentin sialophosphoprotein isoform X2 n=1 Tax=Coccinella septempunctata TaxID=41139 RepID=UPI001D0729AB|nr:dentin sialophosphoprotein isoform X2 [Coccinella septempunctata]
MGPSRRRRIGGADSEGPAQDRLQPVLWRGWPREPGAVEEGALGVRQMEQSCYCQGFNMLAALILQVTDKSETDALKLMIYLIEGVLPDSYFADSLRGLSVDMAVFRELLRTRLPRLSKHLDLLQNLAKEGTTSYEPPLTNVFTMQWFLTLFCNCLPQPSVLRIWDLILLEGNEILLRTALAIWQTLAEKIVRVRTADEFYCIMGLLTTELLENNLIDANSLIKAVVSIGPLTELRSLREHYLYNINPLGPIPNLGIAEKQLKVYPKERINLDISTLKKQYMKLRQRQRQAHIIFSAAINRQPPPKSPVAMNHLLLGKSALVPAKRLGPPKGSIPPARVPTTLHWKDTKQTSSSSSSDTELCDDDNPPSDSSDDANPKSPVPDLPEDNPNSSDTTNVADDVQESPACVVTKDNIENQQGDILESLVNSEFVVRKITDEDSEDDSVDFELFLEDRVKSLKQDGENKRVTLSRRNSERALQIIQENSLILHRILQCQSRLSLSPPATETCNDSDDESTSKKSQSPGISMNPAFHSESTTQDTKDENQIPNSKTVIHPDISDYDLPKTLRDVDEYPFPSKYAEILKKSRNLNEKCDGLFNTGTKKTTELEDQEIQLPESKTFTNQEELIDLTSNFDQNEKKKSYILSEFDVDYSENKIRPWLEKIDLNRNTEYLQSFDEDLAPQQNVTRIFNKPFRDDTSGNDEKDEETKTDQSGPVIPDMIVSFSESRKNSEKEPCTSLRDIDYDWSKNTSFLESRNFTICVDKITERKSLSATNSIEKTDKSNERRSLSATNSIERAASLSATDDVCVKVRRTVKSPDISYESSILSPPRSRLSSSNSRDLMSPMNESSMSISSRVTSPSPEREFESYRRLSPRRTYSTTNEDTRVSQHEEAVIMRTKSPQRNFDAIEDPRNSWEYKNYRESKDRIEKKLYGDPERRIKDLSSSTDNMESSSKESIEESLNRTLDGSKDYSLEHRSSSFSSKSSSLPDQQWKKKNLKLFDGKNDPGEDHSEYGASRSSKLSSPDRGSYSARSSPLLRYEERRDCASPKSPNRVFNPFPVPLSSRQNKEIGVKLGLYKK